MITWLPLRDAYARYAEAATKPVRYDSFRRWVFRGQVFGRIEGARWKVSLESALARARLDSCDEAQYVAEKLQAEFPALLSDPWLLVWVPLDAGEEVILHGGDRAQLIVDALHDLACDLEDDPAEDVTFFAGEQKLLCRGAENVSVVWTLEALTDEFLSAISTAALTARLERTLDQLVARGDVEMFDGPTYATRNPESP